MSTSAALILDPDQDELREGANQVATALGAYDHRARLVGPSGDQIDVPAAILDALVFIAAALKRGYRVRVIPDDHLLTTNEAADILNISRPYLLTLLERGEIAFHYVGTHRRLRQEDVLAYGERLHARREEGLQNMVRHAEELGLPY